MKKSDDSLYAKGAGDKSKDVVVSGILPKMEVYGVPVLPFILFAAIVGAGWYAVGRKKR
jgi:hypothetical protein